MTPRLLKSHRFVENFQERERMELMAIDINGKVTFTSSGFEPGNEVYWIDDRVDKIGAGEDHEKQDRHTHKGDNEDKQDDLLVNPVE